MNVRIDRMARLSVALVSMAMLMGTSECQRARQLSSLCTSGCDMERRCDLSGATPDCEERCTDFFEDASQACADAYEALVACASNSSCQQLTGDGRCNNPYEMYIDACGI